MQLPERQLLPLGVTLLRFSAPSKDPVGTLPGLVTMTDSPMFKLARCICVHIAGMTIQSFMHRIIQRKVPAVRRHLGRDWIHDQLVWPAATSATV